MWDIVLQVGWLCCPTAVITAFTDSDIAKTKNMILIIWKALRFKHKPVHIKSSLHQRCNTGSSNLLFSGSLVFTEVWGQSLFCLSSSRSGGDDEGSCCSFCCSSPLIHPLGCMASWNVWTVGVSFLTLYRAAVRRGAGDPPTLADWTPSSLWKAGKH